MLRAVTLPDLLASYALERHLEASSVGTYRWTLNCFGRWLKRAAAPQDLADETVSLWLQWCEGVYSQTTVAHHRVNLLVLWRWAADRGDVKRQPGRVRREKKPQPMPVAPTTDGVRAALEACRRLPGRYMGCARALWFEALLRTAWESGMRRGDISAIAQEDVAANGTVQLRQRKTGCPKLIVLSPRTIELIRLIPREYPFRSYDQARTYEVLRGLSMLVGQKITLRLIRGAGATDVFRQYGEEGARGYLGHAPGSLTWQCYVDRSQLGESSPRPTDL